MLKNDGCCGECRAPVGPWAGVIVTNYSAPEGLVQSGYLLCRACAELARHGGEDALPRIADHSRQWARLLGLPAEGATQ